MPRGRLIGAILASSVLVARAWAQQGVPPPTPVPTASETTATERGIAAFEAHRYAEAKKVLGRAVAASSTDAEARAYLGLVLLNLDRDFEQAAANLEAAVRIEPQSSRYHQWLGLVYSASAGSAGVFKAASLAKKARAELEKAVELDGRSLEARAALLQYYLMAPGIAGGSLAKAREQALAMTELDRYQGLLAQGGVAEREKDDTRAEELYRAAIAVAPDQGTAYNSLGYVLLREKRRGEAIAAFRTYAEVAPADPNARDSLGEGLLADGKVDESVAEYRKALELDPDFASSYLGLAQGYQRKQAWGEARKALERYLELRPEGRQADEVRDQLARLPKQ